MSKGNFPESLSQRILVGITLVWRLGVQALGAPDQGLESSSCCKMARRRLRSSEFVFFADAGMSALGAPCQRSAHERVQHVTRSCDEHRSCSLFADAAYRLARRELLLSQTPVRASMQEENGRGGSSERGLSSLPVERSPHRSCAFKTGGRVLLTGDTVARRNCSILDSVKYRVFAIVSAKKGRKGKGSLWPASESITA